jgi:hypothetical protein
MSSLSSSFSESQGLEDQQHASPSPPPSVPPPPAEIANILNSHKVAQERRDEFLYHPRDTVYERFTDIPAPGGIRMLNRIMECYGQPQTSLPPSVSDPNKIPWLDPGTGEPNFRAHPLNTRQHDTVLDEYVESIMEHGIVQDCRGRLFCTLNADSTSGLPLQLLTWGTLGRAFYKCVDEHGSHPNIVASLDAGLSGVVILSGRLPRDCIAFVRDYHNQFHGGASDSWIKLLKDTVEVEANWLAHVSLRNPSSSGLAAWLNERYKNKYASVNQFDNTKISVHKLNEYGPTFMEEFTSFFAGVVKFKDRSLTTDAAVMNLYALLLALEKTSKTLDVDTRKTVLYEGYKLMMPLSSMKPHKFVMRRVPPYIIDKSCPTKVKWIITEMVGAKIFEQPPVKKSKKSDATEEATAKAKCKAKSKGKAKSKAKPKPVEMLEDMCPSISDPALKDAAVRPKYFIEDLTCALDVAFAALPFGMDQQQMTDCKTLMISLGLEFCWAGSVQLDGVSLVDYSVVRKKLQDKVFQYCTARAFPILSCNTMFAQSSLLQLPCNLHPVSRPSHQACTLPVDFACRVFGRPGGWGCSFLDFRMP